MADDHQPTDAEGQPDAPPTDTDREGPQVNSLAIDATGIGHMTVRTVPFGLPGRVTVLLEVTPSASGDSLDLHLRTGGIPNDDAEAFIDGVAELFTSIAELLTEEREGLIPGIAAAVDQALANEAEGGDPDAA